MNKTVVFAGYECIIQKLNYQNGRVALQLVDAENGEPVATATVNVPTAHLNSDEVLIKDYSENEGMLACLRTHNVIKETGKFIENGFVVIPVCVLNPESEWI